MELLKALALSFSNYESLRFTVHSSAWYKDLAELEMDKDAFKKLRDLRLLVRFEDVTERDARPLTCPPVKLFKNSPSLTNARLDIKHPDGCGKILLPYSKLLYLDYRLYLRVPQNPAYAIKR
ncbi:hypothetical protein NLJ89_g7602 [Agrocybe chaxingu]|uniref:Uncharacterized protein n=1 Tax=Agrocybe chaxingu TaxID=84603 RepID=A0A9W8K3B2_9AGAR|nr:hypothetical protein NLJ89_g7602 [Agrocybe chaxingu]